MKVEGILQIGLEVDGVWHDSYVLVPLTAGAAIAATENAIAEQGEAVSVYTMRVYELAEQLQQLGTLAKEDITGKLLLSLTASDFDQLTAASNQLTKNLQAAAEERRAAAALSPAKNT